MIKCFQPRTILALEHIMGFSAARGLTPEEERRREQQRKADSPSARRNERRVKKMKREGQLAPWQKKLQSLVPQQPGRSPDVDPEEMQRRDREQLEKKKKAALADLRLGVSRRAGHGATRRDRRR